jgi:hypothetical protein
LMYLLKPGKDLIIIEAKRTKHFFVLSISVKTFYQLLLVVNYFRGK